MTQAQTLVRALNALGRTSPLSNGKARATARQDANVDWPRTKQRNADFNAEVDGCESFVMRDGSVCAWIPGRFTYVAQ
jgi:hypothetical protein